MSKNNFIAGDIVRLVNDAIPFPASIPAGTVMRVDGLYCNGKGLIFEDERVSLTASRFELVYRRALSKYKEFEGEA